MTTPPQPLPAPSDVNWRDILEFVHCQMQNDRPYFDHYNGAHWAVQVKRDAERSGGNRFRSIGLLATRGV
jgi:hypothetical protein